MTVEAEPEDADINKAETRTKTVKIPLRDVSSPVQNADGTGRGRNSQGGSVRAKRSGTPVRGRNNSRSRRKSLTDLDITVLGDDSESDDWTRRKSPKKRASNKKAKVKELEESHVRKDKVEDIRSLESSVTAAPTRPRRESSFEIREDADVRTLNDAGTDLSSDSPLRMIDLNRVSVRPRSLSNKRRDPAVPAESEGNGPDERVRKISYTSNDSYPTPDSSVQDEDETKAVPDPTERHENFDSILESEGFTMIDLESIPSARNFLSSPIEVDESKQETKSDQQTPATDNRTTNSLIEKSVPRESPYGNSSKMPKPTSIPSYLILQDGESDISSTAPSSPPVNFQKLSMLPNLGNRSATRQFTPPTYSSPKLPSPPKPPSPPAIPTNIIEPKASILSLCQVAQAGAALQSALSPKPVSGTNRRLPSLLSPYRRNSSKNNGDDLFNGFDSSTRRELRAGLQFGEDLARTQKSSSDGAKYSSSHEQGTTFTGEAAKTELSCLTTSKNGAMQEGRQDCTDVSGSQKQEQGSQKQKYSGSMSGFSNGVMKTPVSQDMNTSSNLAMSTQARREREWQIEREAVSREIENASASQVIVIDSDDEDDQYGVPNIHQDEAQQQSEEPENDIWLEEAEAYSSSSSNINIESDSATRVRSLFTESEQRKQQERAREVVNRPRRTLIPSPWKRGEDLPEASTFLTNGDFSGMFWQPPRGEIKFGSGEIERARRCASGSLGNKQTSPAKLENVEKTPESIGPGSTARFPDNSLLEEQETEVSSSEDTAVEQFMLDAQLEELDQSDVDKTNSVDEVMVTTEEPSIHQENSRSSFGESSPPPVKVPVNFNDSTLSQNETTPVPVIQRDLVGPSPPRSAMKGARRLSAGLENASFNSPASRRVGFAQRTAMIDENGSETSASVRSDSVQQVMNYHDGLEVATTEGKASGQYSERQERTKKSSGWLSWLLGPSSLSSQGEEENSVISSQQTKSIAAFNNLDGNVSDEEETEEQKWQPTKSTIPSSSTATTTAARDQDIPSYLLPPSYPSDPLRSPSVPLPLTGPFTNSHFRTLHIIHAKSLRPRFHAPDFVACRFGLKSLLGRKYSQDETEGGMGIFEWCVGEREVRVLERFCQEVEWSNDSYRHAGERVKWGWSEEELMTFLFRIVVGEVVRREEDSIEMK